MRKSRLWDDIYGYGDAALTIGSSIAAEPLSGLYGLGVAGANQLGLTDYQGAAAVRDAQRAMTWEPSEGGQRQLGRLGNVIQAGLDYQPPLSNQSIGQDFQDIGDYWRDRSVPALQDTFGDELGAGIGSLLTGTMGILGGPARTTRHIPDLKKTTAGYLESPRLLDLDPANPPSDVTQVGKKRELLRKPAVKARERYRQDGETIRELDETPEAIQLRPEDIQNSAILAHLGDRTMGAGRVTQIGGVPLSRPLELEAGPSYSRLNKDRGIGWGSNKGAASGLQANIDKAARGTGLDPIAVYTGMGPQASNFSTHIAEGALSQLDNLPISKQAKKAFDLRMGPLSGNVKSVEDFVGLDSDELYDQLMGLGGHSKTGAGALRTIFSEEMAQARHRAEGFPIMDEIYDAVNEPELAGMNIGDAGATMFRGREGAPIVPGSHSSYTHDIQGDYIGRLANDIPTQVFFPKMWKATGLARDRRGNPMTHGQRVNAIQTGHGYEVTDQEWVDSVSQWLEENARLRGQ